MTGIRQWGRWLRRECVQRFHLLHVVFLGYDAGQITVEPFYVAAGASENGFERRLLRVQHGSEQTQRDGDENQPRTPPLMSPRSPGWVASPFWRALRA